MSWRLWVLMLTGLAAAVQNREAELAETVRKHSRVLDSAAVREYLEWIGRELAAQLPEGGLNYTFDLLDGPGGALREPTVLPGGYIFVPAGLFLTAESEGEFVGMLAHAMAHASARHGTRMASRDKPSIIAGDAPLIIMGKTTVPLQFLSVRRGFELEADRIAVQAMSGAGYDPTGLLHYIERMQAEDSPELYSSLPPRETRIAGLKQAIAELAPRQYPSGAGRFQQVREAVRELTVR